MLLLNSNTGFMIILILFSSTECNQNNSAENPDYNRQPRGTRSSKCKSALKIRDCTKRRNTRYNFELSKIRRNQFISEFTTTCTFDKTSYDWEIKGATSFKFAGNKLQNLVVIKPYKLKTGKHNVTVVVSAGSVKINASCSFSVREEAPIPVISGGSFRIVPTNQDVTLSGDKSVNLESHPKDKAPLDYRWSCSRNIWSRLDKEFCTTLKATGPKLVIPGKYIERTDLAYLGYYVIVEYSVKLEVRVPGSKKWYSTTHRFQSDSSSPVLSIVCKKNCPPETTKTHSYQSTCLEVTCEKNCKKTNFHWVASYNYYSFVYNKQRIYKNSNNLQFGINTYKFYTYPGKFRSGSTYYIDVGYTPKYKMLSELRLSVANPAQISSCRASPSSGNAITTVFKASCGIRAAEDGNAAFEVLTKIDTQGVIVERGHSIKDLRFRLPSHVKIQMKIIQEDNFAAVTILQVHVRQAFSDYDTFKKIKKKTTVFYKQLEKYLKSDDWIQALQIMTSLSEELARIRLGDYDVGAYKKEIKLKMIQNITDKVPMETVDQVRQINALVTRLLWQNKAGSDPELAEKGTLLCKKAAEKQLELIEEHPLPLTIGSETRDLTIEIMTCVEANIPVNFRAISPRDYTFNYTTPYPVITLDVIDEGYDEYLNHEGVPRNIKKFQNASGNYIETCFFNAMSLAKTLAIGERTIYAVSRYSEVTATREFGKEIVKLEIESNNILVTPSDDLKKIKGAVDVLMCTTKYNPFFWTFTEISSSIVFIKVYDEEGKKYITTFEKPMKIKFHTNQNIKFAYGSTILREEPLERDISIHRFDVKAKENFFIEFEQLESHVVLQYVITIDTKPVLENFSDNKTVSASDRLIYYVNDKSADTWFYISVLPSKVMRQKLQGKIRGIMYGVSVYTIVCNTWSNEEGKWKLGKNALNTSSPSTVYCEFKTLSVITAVVTFNQLILQSSIYLDFAMVLLVDWKIFICTAICFALYGILLTYIAYLIRNRAKTAYFLCDIPKCSRYGYLIIVKTGSDMFAGTTSNVCIRIYGDADTSHPHVLNYPDPEKRLLQRNNEDWFVLSSYDYLGELIQIELWFDCIGRNPSWYCKDITIYDLQSKKGYYFEIENWLRLDIEINVSILEKVKKRKGLRYAPTKLTCLDKVYQAWNNPHPWNLIHNLAHEYSTYFQRLTVMLSILLTIFTLQVFFYYIPRMMLKDGFAPINSYDIYGFVIWRSILSVFITFLIHFGLIWLFRNSEAQFEDYSKNPCEKKLYGFRIRKFCWCALAFIILLDMTVLVGCGFWIPSVTSSMLVTSAILAVFIYVVILENCNRCYKSFKRTMKIRIKYVFTLFAALLDNIEEQRRFLYKSFGRDLLRPHLQHLYHILDLEDIRRKRFRQEIILELLDLFQDLAIFSFYILFLYLIILIHSEPFAYYSQRQARDLVSGISTRSQHLSKVTSFDTLYKYNEFTLVWALQSFQWYDRYILFDAGMMIDQHNKYLGIARFRQQRAIDIACPASKFFKIICQSVHPLENRDFGESWNLTIDNPNSEQRLNESWRYVNAKDSKTDSIKEELMTYSGAGYIGPLGRTLHNSLVNVQYYKLKHWFDKYTRVVFIEFLMYNANCNLFNSIRVIVEKTGLGNFRTKLNVQTMKLLLLSKERRHLTIIIFILFAIIVFFFTIKAITRFTTKNKDCWNYLDLFIAIFSFACLITYLLRMIAISHLLSSTETTKHNQFLNYFELIPADKYFTAFAAILIFLATVRLWKMLRFAMAFKLIEKSFKYALIPILQLVFYHFIIVLSFALVGFVIFGNFSREFRNIPASIVTMTMLSVKLAKTFDFNILTYGHTVLGYVYYFSFLLPIFLFRIMYVVVIIACYRKARSYYSLQVQQYNVISYIKNELRYFCAWIQVKFRINLTKLKLLFLKRTKSRRRLQKLEIARLLERLRQRHIEIFSRYDKRVSAKLPNIRYANCITISENKIEAMKFIALARLIRDYGTVPEDLMLSTIFYYFIKDRGPKEIFFSSNKAPGYNGPFIHNNKLEEIALVVERMLSNVRGFKGKPQKLCKEIINQNQERCNEINNMLASILHILNNLLIDL